MPFSKLLAKRCNAVAGELMAPFDKFLVKWNATIYADSREKIKNLEKHFWCGESVIARKAFDAKKISYDLYIKALLTK